MSKKITLQCTCGKISEEVEYDSNCTKQAKNAGFGFVWNISNGLYPIWLCSKCFDDVRNHWTNIIKIVGTDLVNLNCIKRN